MALDRFVRFDGPLPTRDAMQALLEDFFGDAATHVNWDRDRFFVELCGRPTAALRRQDGVPWFYAAALEEARDRWIEVWLGRDCVDVMTRNADEYTNGCAAALAQIVARWFGGWEEEIGRRVYVLTVTTRFNERNSLTVHSDVLPACRKALSLLRNWMGPGVQVAPESVRPNHCATWTAQCDTAEGRVVLEGRTL